MLLRASLSRCAVTWISASGIEADPPEVAEASALAAESDVADESGAAANTAVLEVVRIKAVATHVGAVEKLSIRITPQKLKKANCCRLLGQFQLARLGFQLKAGGPRLRG
jgi:hypothetical protein